MVEMGDENYLKLIERISKVAGVDKSEIEQKVEAKREKLSGLISKEGATQVIAAELGVSLDNEKLKIDEILPDMKKVNTTGKVINISPIRTFMRNDKEGKVVNMLIGDDTSNIKVVFWDENHIGLVESGKIAEGTVIELVNAGMRDSELHLGSFSEVKISNENMGQIVTEKISKEKNIKDFLNMENVKTRAFIVQIFEPRFFEVCPQCKRKPKEPGVCGEHGKITPEKRALINVVLDDGTESIRGVLFHDSLKELGFNDLENSEVLQKQKDGLLGKEMIFSGQSRLNKMFNNMEFVIEKADEINIDELLAGLEKV